jgi:hypothetical protein
MSVKRWLDGGDVSMKTRQLKITAVIVSAALYLSSMTALAAGPAPFVGHWEGIDIDGSDIRLTIGGPPSGPFQITWTERYISICDGEAGIIRGTGELNPEDPYLLEAELTVECFTTGASTFLHLSISYHPSTGALSTIYPSGLRVVFTHPGKPHEPPAPLALRTSYQENWIEGFYPEDYTVWIAVTEADGKTIKATAEVVTGPVSFWDGEIGFSTLLTEWDPGQPEIEPNDWVYGWVDNGASAQMRVGEITPTIDLENNLVQGTIAADWFAEEVFVYCTVSENELGDHASVMPDGSDTFACDWDGAIDIGQDDVAEVWYWGPDGHAVGYYLYPPPAMGLRVNYGHDWVESFYEPGLWVDLTITESDGETVKATASVYTEPKDFWGGETGFQTTEEDWLPYPPDLQPGDWVYAEVENGVTAQVKLGDIQGEVFVLEDRIEGIIDAGWISDPVQVECLDWGSGGDAGNQDGGSILTNGSNPFSCVWNPETEWDIQPWQDIGVGYFTPDGHWVANAFRAEYWIGVFFQDVPLWAEGNYTYNFVHSFSVPVPAGGESEPVALVVSSFIPDVEPPAPTPVYEGFALLRAWVQRAWTGDACEVVDVIHPNQPTRFVWGWLTDFSMSSEDALAHFASFEVTAQWNDGENEGSIGLDLLGMLRSDEWEGDCSLTEHP